MNAITAQRFIVGIKPLLNDVKGDALFEVCKYVQNEAEITPEYDNLVMGIAKYVLLTKVVEGRPPLQKDELILAMKVLEQNWPGR